VGMVEVIAKLAGQGERVLVRRRKLVLGGC